MSFRFLTRGLLPPRSYLRTHTSARMAQSTSPQQLSSFVEVERKFIPTADLMARLSGDSAEHVRLRRLTYGTTSHNRSSPLSFFRLPDKQIRDIYYDSNDKLSRDGVWLRLRTSGTVRSDEFPLVHDGQRVSEWEAKVRIGGDYTTSRFVELRGRKNVVAMISQRFPAIGEESLEVMADLETLRSSWIVRQYHEQIRRVGEIRIVVDHVQMANQDTNSTQTFQHRVGEVEMTREVVGGTSQTEHDEARRKVVERMQATVDAFIASYPDLFVVSPEVLGKLSAYFAWRKSSADAGREIDVE